MTLNRSLTNNLVIVIDDSTAAGSETSHIFLRFGIPDWLPGGGPIWNLRLNAGFNRGSMISFNFNNVDHEFFDSMPTDHWDSVRLETPSSDSIRIRRLAMNHSGELILNQAFDPYIDLDKPYGTVLDLSYDIWHQKMLLIENSHTPVTYYAIQELGKTDGYKYGTGRLWCSEFVSWCLRKSVYWSDVPSGNIGSDDLVDYFSRKSRLASGSDVRAGSYSLKEGDYLQLNGGTHSGIFYQYINRQGGTRIDPPSSPSENTWIRCIEGNTSRAVRIIDRQLSTVDNAGKTH